MPFLFHIFSVWTGQGWKEPVISENFEPDRITLSLNLKKIGDKKSAIKTMRKELIVEYLTDNAEAKAAQIAEYVHLQPSRVRDYLKELVDEDIVVAEGARKNRIYRLKA